MTGYESKRAMARDKLLELAQEGMSMHSHDAPEYIVCEALIEALAQPAQEAAAFIAAEERKVGTRYGYVPKLHPSEYMDDDDDTQVYKDHGDALTIAYQSGYYNGKKAAQRPWVGLTDADWKEIEDMSDTFDQGVAWCLARLKKRNA